MMEIAALGMIGLFVVRVVVGLVMAAHGAQKLFDWFGGYGLKGTGGWLASIGIKPGVFAALIVGLVEFAGGLLFALGLFTFYVGILIAIAMLVALFKVHIKNGLFMSNNGYEFVLVLAAITVAVAFIGAGDYSLDARLFG
jgi:putative oxidoreductase